MITTAVQLRPGVIMERVSSSINGAQTNHKKMVLKHPAVQCLFFHVHPMLICNNIKSGESMSPVEEIKTTAFRCQQ
jgi:hypothetical protein